MSKYLKLCIRFKKKSTILKEILKMTKKKIITGLGIIGLDKNIRKYE